MYLVRSAFNTFGKLREVGQQLMCYSVSSRHLRPAVIRVDILIPGGLEAQVFHAIGCFQDASLVNVAAIGILTSMSMYSCQGDLCGKLTHEFHPKAGSLPTPPGSWRPKTAGSAVKANIINWDMMRIEI